MVEWVGVSFSGLSDMDQNCAIAREDVDDHDVILLAWKTAVTKNWLPSSSHNQTASRRACRCLGVLGSASSRGALDGNYLWTLIHHTVKRGLTCQLILPLFIV